MQTQYTLEQLRELVICSRSPTYFAEKYALKAYDHDDPIKLTAAQISWLERMNGHIHLGDDRCSYRTSTMLARALWAFLFKRDQTTFFITPKLMMAQHARQSFGQMLENVPDFMKDTPLRMTRERIEGPNGAVINFRPWSTNVGRGQAISLLLIDCSSHFRPSDYDEMRYCLLPCINSKHGAILESA